MQVVTLLTKLKELVYSFVNKGFTGEVTIRLKFHEGGIRDEDITIKKKLDS